MTIRSSSKSGFTLLEMLVASLLLGMLVSILTMVFNSSSIAWRTGKASVAQLSRLRRQMSFAQYRADSLLPRISTQTSEKNVHGFVVSPWTLEGGLRTRAVRKINNTNLDGLSGTLNFTDLVSDKNDLGGSQVARPWQPLAFSDGKIKLGSAKAYTVGVLSLGPDGKEDTEDDITTWPETVE